MEATARRPRVAGEVAIVVVLLVIYDRIAERLSRHRRTGDAHGAAILRAERRVHLGFEHATNNWLSAHRAAEVVATSYYQCLHESTALVVLVGCYLRRADLYRAARNALVLINVVGLTVFVLYPVAPPRSLPGQGFIDSAARVWFVHYPPDHFGAMPSLHLAWAVWAAVVGRQVFRHRALRGFLALHPLFMGMAVVSTANHYVLDVLAGVTLGLAACLVPLGQPVALPTLRRRWLPSPALLAAEPGDGQAPCQ